MIYCYYSNTVKLPDVGGAVFMENRKWFKRRYVVIFLVAVLVFLIVDFVRSQNMVQFAYSHFQACLQEYDGALEAFLTTEDTESLSSAKSAVEHVGHMDSNFLKYHTLSEPLYRKRRQKLTNYLILLTDYAKKLEEEKTLGKNISDAVKKMYEGNQEIEELLTEDSTEYDEISKTTQNQILDRIEEMTDMIQKEME
jgi:hypothetical protein